MAHPFYEQAKVLCKKCFFFVNWPDFQRAEDENAIEEEEMEELLNKLAAIENAEES